MNQKLLWHVARGGALALLLGWAAYTQTAEKAGPPLTIQKLKSDLWVIDGTSNGAADAGNIAVYVTGEGVILVDDRFAPDYDQVLEKIKSVTTQPVKYIINTHHHGDHTGTNAKFMSSAMIVSHRNARKHMIDANMPGPPPITFSDEASVYLGGKEVRAIYYGRGHTDGDIAVYFPGDKTVCLGDLMAGTRGVTNPVVDYSSGGSLAAWSGTLDGVLKLDLETVIPGHGSVTDKAGLLAHRNKIGTIHTRLTQLVAANTPKDEINGVLLKEFDFKPINLRALDGLIAELKQ